MIKVNQSAKEKIKSIEFPEKALGIRILVRSSGCSGLAYVMEYCYKQQPDDLILDNLRSIRVAMDIVVRLNDHNLVDYRKGA